MNRLPEKRAESVFGDFKAGYDLTQALAEARRCLYCHEPPCVTACPSRLDVPTFIRKIGTGNLEGAARVIFRDNPLAMSCARVCPVEVLCSGHCVLSEAGIPPIEVGRLQRYVADTAYERGWRPFDRASRTGRRVALVGAGPASLSAAWVLAREGHDCVIFEQRALPGGLNTTAIAPYKMKAPRALEEVEWLLHMEGIEIRYEVEVGRDVSLQQLDQDFDAVFIGVGLGPDRWMSRVPGAQLPGIEGGIEFVTRVKTGEVSLEGVRHAVVIGGGNTAVDVVRELQGLGVPEVTLLYRRTESDMKAYAHEWAVARQQGARAHWRSLPVAFEGEDRLERIRCARLDENLVAIDRSEFELQADLAIIAIGQSRVGALFGDLDGIEVEHGCLVVDEAGATGREGWYAGGDCVNGGREVVNAAAEGKRAAASIHDRLTPSTRQKGAHHA